MPPPSIQCDSGKGDWYGWITFAPRRGESSVWGDAAVALVVAADARAADSLSEDAN